MYIPWHQDRRPIWRVDLTYLLVGPRGRAGLDDCRGLRDALAATGSVRGARVWLSGGQLFVVALVKADSHAEALRDITWHAGDAVAASERLAGAEFQRSGAQGYAVVRDRRAGPGALAG